MVLSQGCRVGGAGLVTVLPPDAELWPLLCGKQHCHGVTMVLWLPRLVSLLESRNNFWQHCSCVVAAGHCCLLWQNVDHQGSSMVEKYSEEPLLALKSRSEDDGLSPASSSHTIVACFEDMP